MVNLAEHEQRKQKVKKNLSNLTSDLLRITFCGKFKSGKSSLINAFLGVKLLPVKTTTATAVVTKVFYSEEPRAYLMKNGKTKNISFDTIEEYILVKDKTLFGIETSGATEVCIGIPHDLLKGIMLIDTPGLDDDDKLTEITLNEINNTDLAVIVYDANQLFSRNEKVTVKNIDEVLSGNIVFAVNRIDQITSGNMEELREVANQYLSKFGNNYIGKGQIFYTAADGPKPYIFDMDEWMKKKTKSYVFKTNVMKLSRLSIIDKLLAQDLDVINEDITSVEKSIQDLNKKREKIIRDQANKKRKELKELNNNITLFKQRMIGFLDNACIDNCNNALIQIKSKANWYSNFSIYAKEAIKNYYSDFLSRNSNSLAQSLDLDFIDMPDISVLDTFDDIYFSNTAVPSGWGGTAVGAGIGTAIVPGLGTLVGAGIGKFVDWWKADDVARDNCIPAAISKIRSDVTPKIRKIIDDFFEEIEWLIEEYENDLSFTGGSENELDGYNQKLKKLFEYKKTIETAQLTTSTQMAGVKKTCKII